MITQDILTPCELIPKNSLFRNVPAFIQPSERILEGCHSLSPSAHMPRAADKCWGPHPLGKAHEQMNNFSRMRRGVWTPGAGEHINAPP